MLLKNIVQTGLQYIQISDTFKKQVLSVSSLPKNIWALVWTFILKYYINQLSFQCSIHFYQHLCCCKSLSCYPGPTRVMTMEPSLPCRQCNSTVDCNTILQTIQFYLSLPSYIQFIATSLV